MISKGLYIDENKLKLSTEQNKVLLGARQAQHNLSGFSIAISPDFYVKVYGKPKSIWAGINVSRQKIDPKGEIIPVQSEKAFFWMAHSGIICQAKFSIFL